MILLAPQMAQLPRVPDLEAQRAAMKEVSFLVGKWAGEARLLRGPAESVELLQTEEAQYKLGGLILVIEGVGRTKSSGQPVLQAFGIISYDDESATYRMRAFNDVVFSNPSETTRRGQGDDLGLCPGRYQNQFRVADKRER